MRVRHAVRAASRVAIATLALLLGLAGTALAANFTVTTQNDAVDAGGCTVDLCTLRDAVIAANAAGGANTITVPAGAYNLTLAPTGNDDATTGDLNVTAAITINGAGTGNTTIDGGGTASQATDRVFRVESTGSLTLSGATVQHGHPAGGAGTLSDGGGILALGPLSLTDASVSNNFVDGTSGDELQRGGAGIAQDASVPVSLTRVTVAGNAVKVSSGVVGGGGGLMLDGGAAGPVTITDSAIIANSAAGPGGGIYTNGFGPGGALTITGTTIASNHAALPPGLPSSNHAYGGGLATDGFQPVTLNRDSFLLNTADQSGGGILDNGSSAYTITDTTILGNAAVAGCTNCGVDFLGGGGIAADGGNINPGWKLSGDLIANNTAGSADNAGVPGGGIDEDGGDKFTVVNTTIAGNSATGIGGGYEGSGGGSHALTNVTIDGNRAGSGGGDVDNSGGSHFSFANTIVSAGIPNCGGNHQGQLTSQGHNIDSGSSCGFAAIGDRANTDPKLGTATDNGGPTFTESLMSGSPAIDGGDNALCPNVDQRGVPRNENAVCDIGAYELLHSLTVTNTNDSGPGSLRDAITLSGAGSTINFAPGLNGQTITLTGGALTITHALTISGPGAGRLTIDGDRNDTVFDVEADSRSDAVTIAGLTITGGAASGSGAAGGGGIFANTARTLSLNDVTVSDNTASITSGRTAGGGGVFDNGGDINLTNSRITNNSVTITGSTIGSSGGGGIYSNGGSVTVTETDVSGNTVDQSAGSGTGSNGGGGIYSDGGDVTITNSTVNDNSDSVGSSSGGSDGGGGLYSSGGDITLSGATITGNTFTLANSTRGENGGGGLYSEGGAVSVVSSSIDSNTVSIANDSSLGGNNGGGGLFSEGGDVSVTMSSISENSGSVTATAGNSGGGAVFDEGRDTQYLNSTLSGNTMTVSGGGGQNGGGAIHNLSGNTGTNSLSDVTLAGNHINQPGGAIFNRQGTDKFRNTILAGNQASPAGNCAAGTVSGFTTVLSSSGFNLETGNSCGLTGTGDLINTDPKLGPLQNNGGPTRTQALAGNSPAVDAGSCTDLTGASVATDQRGTARPQPAGGHCDIGAYELVQQSVGPATPPSVSGISPSSGPAAGGTSVTITGQAFSGATAVRFGGTPAGSFHVDSDTQITASSPPGSGTVDVTVATTAGTSSTGAADRFSYQAAAPAVIQTAAGPSSSTGAVFSGSVNPNGKSITVYWEYGLDTAYRPPGFNGSIYDQSTPPQTVPAGTSPVPVQGSASNLVPNARYHVRLAADNGSGPVFGPDQTFTTPKGPAPPPPALGTENATPSGSVFTLVGGKLVPLTQAKSLPSGTVIDALHGSVNLIAATGNKGQKFTGAFSGAVFKITQTRGGRDRGLTTLTLVEGAFAGDPTYASCQARAAGPFGHAALSRRILQTLHSSASGRFRTRGRYAAATVRGTKWTTTDRCDGTLVAVQLHSVLVNDLVKRINVVVTAGHSYLARARR